MTPTTKNIIRVTNLEEYKERSVSFIPKKSVEKLITATIVMILVILGIGCLSKNIPDAFCNTFKWICNHPEEVIGAGALAIAARILYVKLSNNGLKEEIKQKYYSIKNVEITTD